MTPDVQAFGVALTAAMADRGVRAPAVAESIGLTDDAVRKWMGGRAQPDPQTLFAVERLLEVAPGALSHHLGYVPAGAPTSVEEAVAADSRLNKMGRAAVLGAYRAVRS